MIEKYLSIILINKLFSWGSTHISQGQIALLLSCYFDLIKIQLFQEKMNRFYHCGVKHGSLKIRTGSNLHTVGIECGGILNKGRPV